MARNYSTKPAKKSMEKITTILLQASVAAGHEIGKRMQ